MPQGSYANSALSPRVNPFLFYFLSVYVCITLQKTWALVGSLVLSWPILGCIKGDHPFR